MLEEARRRLQLIEQAQRHLHEDLDAIAGRLIAVEAELSVAATPPAESRGGKAVEGASEAAAQS